MALKNGHLILATALYNITLPLIPYLIPQTFEFVSRKKFCCLGIRINGFSKIHFMGSTSSFQSNLGVSINLIKDFPSQIPYYYIIHQLQHPKFFSLFFLFFFDSISCQVLNVLTFSVNHDKKAITI